MIRQTVIAAALLAAYLHACAEAVAPSEPNPDAAVDAQLREASADEAACPENTVEFEGACCFVARDDVCGARECERLHPDLAGQTFCANPQLCCVRP